MGREKGSSNRASALTQQWEISAFSMKAAEQDEGLVLDTAEAAAFRLSAEHMQKDLVLPFPQAADELQVQLSTASFPTLFSTARDREQSQHKASPPQDLCQGPLDRGVQEIGEPQHTPNSHTPELRAGGRPLKGLKFNLSALLVLPSCTMGQRTLCTAPLQ